MERNYRIAIVCLLFVATVGLCVQYGQADRWSYPSSDAISTDPGAYDGTTLFLFASVRDVSRDTATISVKNAPYQIDAQAINPEQIETIEPGASIQVYGVFESDSQTVVAENIVIDFADTADRLYVYATSLLGAVFAAGWFLRFWRPNWRQLRFEPRSDR